MFRCGVVAVLGKPNVGKSTLMNQIVGEKVAITSPRPQTTRKPIIGIANLPGAQVIFRDTAGIHLPQSKLGKAMVDLALQALEGADAFLFVVDVSRPPDDLDERIVKILGEERLSRTVVALNKMDRLRPEHVIANYDAYESLTAPAEMMMTNSLIAENVDKLLSKLVLLLPTGPAQFDNPDMYTTQTMREMAAEIVREKALANTREEVPHGIAVRIDEWEESEAASEKPITRINATIFVEKRSQKPILIGHDGLMLKRIGQAAREELERLIGTKVFLGLFVKVREGWRETPSYWSEIGL